MPETSIRQYQPGSIIYFEGDMGKDIYLLQKGVVKLTYSNANDEEEEENIKIGEFFGIKSALGFFPREATARVLTDSAIIILSTNTFRQLCYKNSTLTLRLLKELSSQLRTIHKQVRQQLVGESEPQDTSKELLELGKYYYNKQQLSFAKYVFEKYLHYHPDPHQTQEVQAFLDKIREKENLSYAQEQDIINDNIEVSTAPDTAQEDTSALSNTYFEAINDLSQGNIDTAIEKFKQVTNSEQTTNQEDSSYIEQATLELSKCYLKQDKVDETFEQISYFIKKYPRSSDMKKAILVLAKVFELKEDIPKAISLYKKVVAMEPKDQDTIKAQNRCNELVKNGR